MKNPSNALGHWGIEFTFKYRSSKQPSILNGKVINQNVGFVVLGYSWTILSQLIHTTIVVNIQIFRESDAFYNKKVKVVSILFDQHTFLHI